MVEARDLFKYYGARRALGPVSFDIRKGEIVGFLGLNGAGKTTCLRILACDLKSSGGSVRIGGEDIANAPRSVRARVGFLPDTPPVYPEMAVTDYLQFAGRLRGVNGPALDEGVAAAIELAQLRDVKHRRIGALSHGYQQRVGIAQSVVHRPSLLILDEPFSGLDPMQMVEMRAMVKALAKVTTILLSSHNLFDVSETCDRILMIKAGQIVASGTQAELARQLLPREQLELEVRGDGAKIDACVRTVGGVTDARLVSEQEGVAILRVSAASDVREELCRALVTGGFGVRRLERAEFELESLFLQLARRGTEGEPREEHRHHLAT
jgi:ABC-2 type transport system ATP-binding protein